MSEQKTKKGKKALAVIMAVVIILGAACFGVISSVINYVKLDAEEFDKAALVVSDKYVKINDKTVRLTTPSKASKIVDVYCIERGRVYFAYSIENTWGIASIDMEGKNITVYYKYENGGKYQRLSTLSDYSDALGGLYYESKIYLKGQSGIIVLDLNKETVEEKKEMPKTGYKWTVSDGKASFGKPKDKENADLTLYDIADKSHCGAALRKLGGNSGIITEINSSNGSVFFVGQITGRFGIKYAVLFRYDTETDTYKYLGSAITETDASSIPVISFFGKGRG